MPPVWPHFCSPPFYCPSADLFAIEAFIEAFYHAWDEAEAVEAFYRDWDEAEALYAAEHEPFEAPPVPPTSLRNGLDELARRDDECQICFEDCSPTERRILHGEQHWLCRSCIAELLQQRNAARCPTCRAELDVDRLRADLRRA